MEASNQAVKSENLNEFVKLVEGAMRVVDRYEISKPGNIAFTKLEEAILWTQVLVNQIALKKVEEPEVKEGELIKNK